MNYPLISEYIEAIKSAEDNFKELTNLRPVLGDDGQPIMSAGGFSVVFKMKDERDGKNYAVKCFTKEQDRRAESYRLIADELEYVSSNYLTPIKYYEKELFVDTTQTDETEFPVLLMDWVEGETLDAYIKKNINNQYALEILAYQFNKLSAWLLTQPFAHGDLKPDNILIKDNGMLVLVDYDGMFVPAMKGYKSRENGSPGYRHPSRKNGDFDEHIDDFSIASIAMSLKAIALRPALYVDYGGKDRLLFSEQDFVDLRNSTIFTSLHSLMSDREFCTLYGVFMIAWAKNSLSSVSYKLFFIERKWKESIMEGVCKYIKGREYIYSGRYKEVYLIFEELSKSKNTRKEKVDGIQNVSLAALGENGLGYMYNEGLYVSIDYAKAFSYFHKAADKNFPMALYNLGQCYFEGKGVGKNYDKGNELQNRAREMGFKGEPVVASYDNYYEEIFLYCI